jgi:rifampicin phosphotransferase
VNVHPAEVFSVIREQQARDFTLAWPVLRTCARRLGRHLADTGVIGQADDLFFGTRTDLDTALAGPPGSLAVVAAERRTVWRRQRRLAAPLTLGRPPRLIGDVIAHAVAQARGTIEIHDGMIVGHPASTGRATGPVRIVDGPEDFTAFADGSLCRPPPPRGVSVGPMGAAGDNYSQLAGELSAGWCPVTATTPS